MRIDIDMSDFKRLQAWLEGLTSGQLDYVYTELVKELAEVLVESVKGRTPVGVYPAGSGRVGGKLKSSWAVTGVTKSGASYEIKVLNKTTYAAWVEFGHEQTPGRYVPAIGKRLVKDFVPGRFMLTISVKELEGNLEQIIETRLNAILKGVFR